MIVSFRTQEMRDRCASLEQAEAMVGPAHAQDLITLLSDVEATETAADLIDLYAPNVVVEGHTIALLIGTKCRLTFVAIGRAITDSLTGDLDWREVQRLKLVEISTW